MSLYDIQHPRDNQFLNCGEGELCFHAKTREVLIAQYTA